MYYVFSLCSFEDLVVPKSWRVFWARNDDEAKAKAEMIAKCAYDAGVRFRSYIVDKIGDRVVDERW